VDKLAQAHAKAHAHAHITGLIQKAVRETYCEGARPPVVEPYDHSRNLWAILSDVITSPGSNAGR